MGTTVNATIRSGISIPIHQLDPMDIEALKQKATWTRYIDPYVCKKCEYKDERPANCKGCENFEQTKFYRTSTIKDTPVIIFRKGLRNQLETYFRDRLKITDRQTTHRMSTDKYRFNYKMLNDQQVEAHDVVVDKISKGYNGVLKSPPRTGKTVMATSVIMTLNRRTIFIAHQEDLLIGKGQLISTFTDKTKEDAPINPGKYFTNLAKFIGEGETPIKYARTLEDFLKYDICLTTYQVFLHPRGKQILKVIYDKFGLLVIDEAHRVGSNKYSRIIDKFTCPRLALTATPKRKDGKHVIMKSVTGDIIHETKSTSLTPKVSVVRTGFQSKKMYKMWPFFLRFLEDQEIRIQKVLRFAKRDVQKGYSILIPVQNHSQIESLVERLNSIGIKAIGWHGKLKKKDRPIPLAKSASGEVDVIVAMRSMLTGINIPRWSMLYWIVPMNNDPNFEQEYKRVCTPMPGKKEPVVRFFVDDHEVVERCFFNCANVIKRDGGIFTESALEEWTRCGVKFNKIKAPKDKTKKVYADPLFDADVSDIDEDYMEKERSKAKAKSAKSKTKHLTKRLI